MFARFATISSGRMAKDRYQLDEIWLSLQKRRLRAENEQVPALEGVDGFVP
jgi:hypothetical protein